MRILHRELCLPRVRPLIQEFLLPSPDPTSIPQPAQVALNVMTPSLLLLEILPYPCRHLLMLMPLQLYLDLVCPPFLPLKTIRASDLYYIAIRFKPSPFFQIDQSVSGIAECPGMRCQLTVVYIA
jgi:hypothetical protein